MNQQIPPQPPTRMTFDAILGETDLVIFDFDGVIADSEVISLSTLQRALSDYGIDMTADDVRRHFLGTSLKTTLDHVANHPGARPVDGFVEHWTSTLYQKFAAELQSMDHIAATLDRLEADKVPYCIASSGTFERIGVALRAIGMTHRFEHIFSAQQVERGKPAPDLFLLAARALSMSPHRCLVIEDSHFGIRAAQAANMRSIGFVGGAHLTTLATEHAETLRQLGADAILSDFKLLAEPDDTPDQQG
jgi:HAD superfamily hydrolase (TIGR01509 family)